MKKMFKFASAVIASVLAAACAKEIMYETEQTIEKDSSLVPMTITANIDSGKAAIDGLHVVWEEGDKIAVFDGVAKREFFLSGGQGTTTGIFSGEVSAEATEFYAVSPFSAAASFAEGTFSLNFPSWQTVATGQFVDPKALVQVGKVDNGSLALKNVFSRASIIIGNDGIKSLMILSNGEEKIAGTATCAVDGVATASATAVGEIRLMSTEPEGFARGTYYVTLLPTTLESGFKVSLSSDDMVYLCSSAKVNEFARNGGKNLGDIVVNPNVKALPVGIGTGAELKQFVDNADIYGSNITVYLKNDIDMAEVSGEWSTPKPFYCTFDGKGYSVRNFMIVGSGHVGILGDAHGDVKDVTFGTEGGNDRITASGEGSVARANVAPITGAYGAVSITNVINHSSVNVAEDAPYATNVAGIVATMETSGVLDKCFNYGAIDAKNNVAEWLDLGGIVGAMNNSGTISDCANYGTLSCTSPTIEKTINVGGIAGGSARGIIEGCVNEGAITVSKEVTTKGNVNLGGIIGYNNGAMTRIGKCTNMAQGKILVASNSTAGVTSVGGIVGKTDANSLFTECENYADIIRSQDATSSANVNLAGIAGMANAKSPRLVSCVNNGDILNAGTTGTLGNFAGIVGDMTSGTPELSHCINNGKVSNTVAVSGKYFQISGIAGAVKSACKIEDCTNNGAISNTGNLTNLCLGGIVGENGATAYNVFKGNVNTGEVSNTGTIATRYCVGGITGRAAVAATYTSCANRGNVSAFGPSSSGEIKVGGVVGENSAKCTYDKCSNESNVGAGDVVKNVCLGGIVADVTAGGVVFTECQNLESATVNLKAAKSVGQAFVGGILGRVKGSAAVPASFTSCSNYGRITLETPSASSWRYIGGIVADLDNNSGNSTLTSCVNGGVVLNKTAINNANGCRFGGLVGNSIGGNTIKNCTNNGAVVNESASTNPHFGGILGYSSGAVTITGCICTSDARIQQKGNATIANMGGILGTTAGAARVENCKSAAMIEVTEGTVTTINARQIEGGNINNQVLASVKGNGIGGTVLGTAVTEENYASFISLTGTPSDCYYWNGIL